MKRRLAAIVCYDAVGFTSALTSNEADTLAEMALHRRDIVDPLAKQYGGRVVKRTGDGALLEFPSPVPALAFALEMQSRIEEHVKGRDAAEGLRYRIGLTIGDVFDDGEDLYGDGINLATRLETLSEPGGIVISDSFREQLHGKVVINLKNLGEVSVKPGDRPITAYNVVEAEIQAQATGYEHATQPNRWPMIWLFAVASLAMLTVTAWFLWNWLGSTVPAGSGGTPKVAVLPLETPAEDAELRWLGDGISDDIVTYLSRYREFRALSRESSFRYASGSPDYTAIRRDLGADFLVAGRVRVNDDKVFLALRLIETQDGTQVWSQKYEGLYTELLSIREDMLQRVTAHLFSVARAELGARVASRAPTNLKAYELVLRGWRAYHQFNRAATLEAEALADRAIAIDPDYAPAFALRARLHIQFYVQPYDNRRGETNVLDEALAAAQRAVTLDSRSADALAWLGHVHIWKGEHLQALEDIERAIALNPSSASIWFIYADGLSRAGRQQDALNAWSQARRLDSVALPLNDGLEARSHLLLGNVQRAYELTSECLRRVPKLLPCHLFHIMAARETGRDDEVQASVEVVRQVAPRFTVSGWRNIIRFGDIGESDRMSRWLIEAGLAP